MSIVNVSARRYTHTYTLQKLSPLWNLQNATDVNLLYTSRRLYVLTKYFRDILRGNFINCFYPAMLSIVQRNFLSRKGNVTRSLQNHCF